MSVGVEGLPKGEETVDIPVQLLDQFGRIEKSWDLRVMQPEDWVKCRVGKHGHVPSTAHKVMDRVVHILNRIIATATTIGIACVGEGRVAPLIGEELVGQIVQSLSIGIQLLVCKRGLGVAMLVRMADRSMVVRDLRP